MWAWSMLGVGPGLFETSSLSNDKVDEVEDDKKIGDVQFEPRRYLEISTSIFYQPSRLLLRFAIENLRSVPWKF